MEVALPTPRTRFPDISARAWQHPRDAAALSAIRQLPGLDDLAVTLLKGMGRFRLKAHLGRKPVKVSPSSAPRVDALYTEALQILDAPERYPLFITVDDRINAATLGAGDPTITLTSGAVSALSDEELLVVLGHELGHLLCDHVLYQSLSRMLLSFGMRSRSPVTIPGFVAAQVALQTWRRSSELTADRASLLVVQDPEIVGELFARLGQERETAEDLRAKAASERESLPLGERFRKTFRYMVDAHPERHHRALEVALWAETDDYKAVLGGAYPLRSDDPPTASDRVEQAINSVGRWALDRRSAALAWAGRG